MDAINKFLPISEIFFKNNCTFIKIDKVANKVEVFNRIKDIHHRAGVAAPQVLLSVLLREHNIDMEELTRHLEGLHAMGLIKFKGTGKGAVELTNSGLTTNMKMLKPKEEPEPTPERI